MLAYYILIVTFFISHVPAYSNDIINTPASKDTINDNIYNNFKDMDKAYEGKLPWEDNQKFKDAIKKHNTPLLMAAYKASLPDPIYEEAYNIALAADQLAGKVVQPGETFSQNKSIGPYTRSRGYRSGPTYAGNRVVTTTGGGVCKIASMLYNVVTFSDLKVIMRSEHAMIVPYVPPGQDATVCYGTYDFRFQNNTNGPIVIWSQKVGDTLYMALYGQNKPPKVIWHHKVLKREEYVTKYYINPSLVPDSEKVIMVGLDGYVVKSWVTVETPDGNITIKDKGISRYDTSPRIIEHNKPIDYGKKSDRVLGK